MEVPGIRRVRSTSIRGGTEISAQFDPSTDMIVALQQVQNRVAEIRGDLPADTELQVERLTPAVFPMFILSLTGSATDRRSERLRGLRDAAVARARAGRGTDRGALQRHARNRSRPRSAPAHRCEPDGPRCVRGAKGAEPARCRWAGSPNQVSSTSRWRLACGQLSSRSRRRPSWSKNGATIRVADLGDVSPGRAGSHAARHRQRPRRGLDQHLAADRREHPRP